jgi:transposase
VLPLLRANNQTLILDPHPVHCAHIVQEFLERHRIYYIYLSPYSPELNPIEEAWFKFKHFLKHQKAWTLDRLLETLNQAA